MVVLLRVALALEFLAGLGAWALFGCPWPLACLVLVASFTAFLLSWDSAGTPKSPGGYVARDGARGFWCAGPGSPFACRDCAPESRP